MITANNLAIERTMFVYNDIADMYDNPELGYYYNEKCNQRLIISIAIYSYCNSYKG